ncbi:MAG: LamG domain-containing protein [Candidatus Moraniibacteriota bacterium]
MNFTGASYVNIGDPVSGILDFGTGDFSATAWVKTTESAAQRCILSKAGGGLGFRFGYDAGRPYYLLGGTITYQEGVIGSTTLNDGSWHHLVMLYSYSGSMIYAYIDGVSAGSTPITSTVGSISNTDPVYVGSMSGAGSGNVTGSIDEVRMYSKLVSTTEISSLYNMGR